MGTQPDFETAFGGEDAAPRFDRTQGITQDLERDIINFLSSKHTDNATITVAEVMRFYDCPAERARRVIKNLREQGVLAPAGVDTYRVII